MAAPSRTFLLRQLIGVAEREGELLAAGEWEQALELHEQFDRHLAQLQVVVAGAPFTARHRGDLTRLDQLHRANQTAMQELQGTARAGVAETSSARQLSSYAPLGRDHEPAPRYLDQSA